MAVPETDLARLRRWADARVPARVRDKVWVEIEVDALSVTIHECHASSDPAGSEPLRTPVARLRYVATRKVWELYWCDSDLRFHRYDRVPASSRVEILLAEIDADPTCLFWG